MARTAGAALTLSAAAPASSGASPPQAKRQGPGAQRLSLPKLKAWEDLGYGMFVCFGMETYVRATAQLEVAPANTYNPGVLDVDQWVQIARDAGMRYAVLTAKHVSGHCLWPSRYTKHTVANSGNKTDVVEAFVKACDKRGVLPGIHYMSLDGRHRFGGSRASKTPLHRAYTTSFYQDFQTVQVTELLTAYGDIAEMWINIPRVLGRGYRTFLYRHIAELQPECVVVMHNELGDGKVFRVNYTWPSDVVTMTRSLPPPAGHEKWREIEGKTYYMPGEVVDTLGKEWFYVQGDRPRPSDELKQMYVETRKRGANLLLAVQPDRQGLIPDDRRDALIRLRKDAGI